MHDAKTHLSRYLAELQEDDVLVICKRNVPVAEVRKLSGRREAPRPIGLEAGSFEIPEAFFEPLPEDMVTAFEGGEG